MASPCVLSEMKEEAREEEEEACLHGAATVRQVIYSHKSDIAEQQVAYSSLQCKLDSSRAQVHKLRIQLGTFPSLIASDASSSFSQSLLATA